MSIRSFLALPIPKKIADQLGDLAASMACQDKSNAVRWVDQANYHITLAFLGNQNERELESLAEHLEETLPHNAIDLDLSHFSLFPERKPKLIAAIITAQDELKAVHQQAINSIMATGMKIEKRRFAPHITLGRLRHSRNQFAGRLTDISKTSFSVNEVVLYESILTPNGAEYEPLTKLALSISSEYEGENEHTNSLDRRFGG